MMRHDQARRPERNFTKGAERRGQAPPTPDSPNVQSSTVFENVESAGGQAHRRSGRHGTDMRTRSLHWRAIWAGSCRPKDVCRQDPARSLTRAGATRVRACLRTSSHEISRVTLLRPSESRWLCEFMSTGGSLQEASHLRSGPFVAVAISETEVRPRLRRGGRRASDSRLSLPRIVGPLMIVTTVCSFAAFYDVCRLGLQTG